MAGMDAATYTRERPGMSAFVLENGVVYHTYSAYARGLDALGACGSGSTARQGAQRGLRERRLGFGTTTIRPTRFLSTPAVVATRRRLHEHELFLRPAQRQAGDGRSSPGRRGTRRQVLRHRRGLWPFPSNSRPPICVTSMTPLDRSLSGRFCPRTAPRFQGERDRNEGRHSFSVTA